MSEPIDILDKDFELKKKEKWTKNKIKKFKKMISISLELLENIIEKNQLPPDEEIDFLNVRSKFYELLDIIELINCFPRVQGPNEEPTLIDEY